MKGSKGGKEGKKGDGESQRPQNHVSNKDPTKGESDNEVSPLPNYISPAWPVQSLIHGCIIGVVWDGPSTNDNEFVKEDVDISIGRSSAEASASLLAIEYADSKGGKQNINFPAVEQSLTAFNFGHRNQLNQQDGDFLFQQTLHGNTFRSLPGEYADEPLEEDLEAQPSENTISNLNEQSLGSGPNYFLPRKMIMNLTNTKRSTRHDEDRYQDHENGLKCRVTNNLFSWHGAGNYVCENISYKASIPFEINGLIHELCSIDRFATYASTTTTSNDKYDFIENIVYNWRGPELAKFPSTIGVNGWTQAWIPLFADVKYRNYILNIEDWKLGKADFELTDEMATLSDASSSSNWTTHTFRTPITVNSGRNLATKIKEFREEFIGMGRGAISGLNQLESILPNLDMVSIALDLNPEEAISTLSMDSDYSSIVEIETVTLIDAFGQTQVIDTLPGSLGSCEPEISLSLQTTQDDRFVLNKPRLQHPARLKFRFIDAHQNSSSGPNPVCGFILCDHLEWAIEVFDQNGEALGQLSLQERDIFAGDNQKSRTVWNPAPGSETQLGRPNDISNKHLREMFSNLVKHSMDDIGSTEISAGVLSCFMKLLDLTMDTIFSPPTEAENLPTIFAGRPIALVRAELELEVDGSTGQLEEMHEISLGSIDRSLDGLLGFFLDDDYTTFHSISNSMDDLSHSYIVHSSQVKIQAGQKKQLTLVIDPLAQVTARIGLLPERALHLKSEYRKEALAKIAPTYRFGPLLLDPTSISMPLPSLRQDVNWTWISKPTVSEWKEDNVSGDSQSAKIPEGRAVAWNGWLKIDPIETEQN